MLFYDYNVKISRVLVKNWPKYSCLKLSYARYTYLATLIVHITT